MKLTRALRLRRQDLARLTELHRAQFVAAIAPGKPDLAESFIEGTGAEDVASAGEVVSSRRADSSTQHVSR